jgi:hypothetical protein
VKNLTIKALGIAGIVAVAVLVLAVVPASASSAPATTGPPFTSSISGSFNSFNIPSGDTVWFSAVMTLTGPAPASDLTIKFVGQKLTFNEPGGASFVVSVPKAEVDFSTTATAATTVWSTSSSEWITTVPVNYHNGNVFLAGFAYHVGPSGIPGGTHVTWSGRFVTPECLFQLNWQWGAAVYTQFAGTQSHQNYGSVGVKPVDDNQLSPYKNSDHAGTPESYTAYLAQGGTGGGGSNYTGSYSATASVTKPRCF